MTLNLFLGGMSMSNFDETVNFNFDHESKNDIDRTLKFVYQSLEEKGYRPIDQIVGYLLSGDPAYIPRHNDARNKIKRFERDEILEVLIRNFIEKN